MAVAGLDQFDDVLVDLDEAAVERRVALQDGQGGQAEEGVELVHGVAEGFRAHRGEHDVVEGLVDGDEQVVVFFLNGDAGFLVQLVEAVDVQVRAPQQCGRLDGEPVFQIDNQYLDDSRSEGVFLRLDRMVETPPQPLTVLSTSKVFRAGHSIRERLGEACFGETPAPIGTALSPELFHFRRALAEGPEGHDLLEAALAPVMPALVTSPHPALDAARFVTQAEFDRTYRSILREPAFATKNVLFVSGLNIDVSPREGFPFPFTKFVPWAAYARLCDGRSFLLEQEQLVETLRRMPGENPDCLSFDGTIEQMTTAPEIRIPIG